MSRFKRHRPVANGRQSRRYSRVNVLDSLMLALLHSHQRAINAVFIGFLELESNLVGQQIEQRRSQAKDVAMGADAMRFSFGLFGAHELNRSHYRTVQRHSSMWFEAKNFCKFFIFDLWTFFRAVLRTLDVFGTAPIKYQGLTLSTDHDVFRFDVAM